LSIINYSNNLIFLANKFATRRWSKDREGEERDASTDDLTGYLWNQNQRNASRATNKPQLRRSEIFIALSTKKTIAPFGGAECHWISTYQVEFRPSEGRRIDGPSQPINILPLRGDQAAHSWLALVTTSKKVAKKTRSCWNGTRCHHCGELGALKLFITRSR
jgi:hypothetical protein